MTYDKHKLGDKISGVFKIAFGFSGLLFVLACIFGPLVIFSSINPIAESNLVHGSQFQIDLEIEEGRTSYLLY